MKIHFFHVGAGNLFFAVSCVPPWQNVFLPEEFILLMELSGASSYNLLFFQSYLCQAAVQSGEDSTLIMHKLELMSV